MTVQRISLMAALIGEACITYLIVRGPTSILMGSMMLLAMAVHIMSSMLFASAYASVISGPHRMLRSHARVLLFIPTFLLPVVGMLGMALAVIPALLRSPRPRASWDRLGHWTLPEQASAYNTERGLKWAVGFSGKLQSQDSTKRCSALIGTLSLRDEMSIPLLRRALKDPEDEVRLLAYALLNRKEKAIEKSIRVYERVLVNQASAHQANLRKAISNAYWQLAQLSAPVSSTQLVLLARAREHALVALENAESDGGLHLLLGQILLAESCPDAAATEFLKAWTCGVDSRRISPYLAKAAFMKRQYTELILHLKGAGLQHSLSGIGGALDFWIQQERAQSVN